MTTARIAFLVLVSALCVFSSSVRADDLIRRGSHQTITDVVVQIQFGEVTEYWSVENGILWKRSVHNDEYSVEFAPDELGNIRDTWRRAGVISKIEYKNGQESIELFNSSLVWITPKGFTLIGPDPQTRRKSTLSFTDHAAIPLSNVSTLESMDLDGSLLVTPKVGAPFSAHVQNESASIARTPEPLELLPAVSGFTYEPDGAFYKAPVDGSLEEPKPYFKEHRVPFAEIRRITTDDSVTSATKLSPHDLLRRPETPVNTTAPLPGESSSKRNSDESDSIRREIVDIEASKLYLKMPVPQAVVPTSSVASGGARYTIENDTAFSLTLLLTGPVTQKSVIPAGATQILNLPAGTYKVAARVTAQDVLPFFGNQSYDSSHEYQSRLSFQ